MISSVARAMTIARLAVPKRVALSVAVVRRGPAIAITTRPLHHSASVRSDALTTQTGEMLSKLLVALGKNDAPALSRTLVDLFSNLTSKGKGAGDVSLLGLRIKMQLSALGLRGPEINEVEEMLGGRIEVLAEYGLGLDLSHWPKKIANWYRQDRAELRAVLKEHQASRAARDGNIAALEECLKDGIDVNKVPLHAPYDSPLIVHAAANGRKQIVEFLIGKKANVDAVHRNDKTALIAAASEGHKETCEVLLRAGADRARTWCTYTAAEIAKLYKYSELSTFIAEWKLAHTKLRSAPQELIAKGIV